MTHPHPDVVSRIADAFVAYRIDMLARHPDFREACAGARVGWGPTYIVADARGLEVRRWTGWLPPAAFVAELELSRALADYGHGRFDSARDRFAALVESDAPIRDEALYWQGAAAFLAGGKDWSALREAWGRLAREFPDSRFGIHASVIEDAPDGRPPSS